MSSNYVSGKRQIQIVSKNGYDSIANHNDHKLLVTPTKSSYLHPKKGLGITFSSLAVANTNTTTPGVASS